MRHRRRKRPVVWLKNTGSQSDSALAPKEQSSFTKSFATMAFGPGNPENLVEIPLVLDNPQEVAGSGMASPTLASLQAKALDAEQQLGYKLLRIVGNLHVGLAPASSADGTCPGLLAVTASLIIRRVDANGVAVASSVAESVNDTIDNIDDPFIWRRNWLIRVPQVILTAGTTTFLPNPPATDNTRSFVTAYNNANNDGTGVTNTCSVDTKSKRRVAAEERLFLDVCFTHFGSDLTTTQDTFSVNHMIHFDYRVLGTLTFNTGNRRNASR